MKIYTTIVSLIFTTCLALPAMAGARTVDCNAGESLQEALDAGAGSAKQIEIEVTGTCYGDLRLTRDRVSILGDGATTIHGTLRVFGSSGIVLRDLTITGPGFGILMSDSRARLFDVHIVDNESSGIQASDYSTVRLTRGEVNGNWEGVRLNQSNLRLNNASVDSNDTDGVLVLQNSSLTAGNSSISENGVLGIRVNWSSSIYLGGSRVESNTYGIQMATGSSGSLNDSQVVNSTQFGIELTGNSALEVWRGLISGNGDNGVWVNAHSFLTLSEANVVGNGQGVAITRDGGVVTYGFTQILSNSGYFQVGCDGDESSIEVDGDSVVGPIDCEHPEF